MCRTLDLALAAAGEQLVPASDTCSIKSSRMQQHLSPIEFYAAAAPLTRPTTAAETKARMQRSSAAQVDKRT